MEKKEGGFFEGASRGNIFAFGLIFGVTVVAIIGAVVLLSSAAKPMKIVEDVEEVAANEEGNVKPAKPVAPVAVVATKSAKPVVELFVMSHCPYGTQIEKGILPVVEALGDKIDYELKFCTYAMHSKKELDEQLTQYCVQKEGKDKIHSYLGCFLEDESKSEECLKESGVNIANVKSCVASTDKEFAVSAGFEDKSTWSGGRYPLFNVYKEDNEKYGVGGSPTLIINGEKVSSGRDSAGLLSAICSAFEEAPEECNLELSSASPSPGFGYGAGAATDASCN